jgi:PKD repeat protein
LTACHTYTNPGDYNISLNDTLRRHDFFNPTCVGQVVNPIHVIPDVVANFTFVANGTIVDFTNTSAPSDSVWWDFGDTLAGTSTTNPQHTFPTIGTYDVWLYAFNECSEDSVMIQVTVDDVGIEKYNLDFKMYPNPANANVNVSGLAEGSTLELMNILGESIQLIVTQGNNAVLATENLSNGTYFVRVTTAQGQVTKKLVVRH